MSKVVNTEINKPFELQKAFQRGYEQGRADAIDDLVKMVCKYYTQRERDGVYVHQCGAIKQLIADFGEQIKEQNSNSNSN